MASTADFRNGMVIEFNNDLYVIVSVSACEARQRAGIRAYEAEKH